MTLEEAIERYTNNAKYEREHGNLQGCLDFKQLVKWLEELKTYRDDGDYKNVVIKLENAKDTIEGLKEELRDAREELRWR